MSFLTDRIAATEALIIAWENAATALANGAQSYTIDTGQSRQTVTKADLQYIQEQIKFLDSRLANYTARAGAHGPMIGRPGF